MEPLVSVLTPAFQAEGTLGDAVESMLAQTHQNWEMYIVADDDINYREYLLSKNINDSRIHFLNTPTLRSGPNVGRNIALSVAKGEWIAPLDADDVYYPERLEKLLIAAWNTGLSLDNVNVVGSGMEPYLAIENHGSSVVRLETFKSCNVPLLFLFHRSLIKQGWDEDICRGADTIFNLRALQRARMAEFVPEPYHEYRIHGSSMCHAQGAEILFEQAYNHTLHRLLSDGLGFEPGVFLDGVVEMIKQKQGNNKAFSQAVNEGFKGSYQHFVKEQQCHCPGKALESLD